MILFKKLSKSHNIENKMKYFLRHIQQEVKTPKRIEKRNKIKAIKILLSTDNKIKYFQWMILKAF